MDAKDSVAKGSMNNVVGKVQDKNADLAEDDLIQVSNMFAELQSDEEEESSDDEEESLDDEEVPIGRGDVFKFTNRELSHRDFKVIRDDTCRTRPAYCRGWRCQQLEDLGTQQGRHVDADLLRRMLTSGECIRERDVKL